MGKSILWQQKEERFEFAVQFEVMLKFTHKTHQLQKYKKTWMNSIVHSNLEK